MKLEEELKIIPQDAHMSEEAVLELLSSLNYELQGQIEEKYQEDTYYDDSNKTLHKAGKSLRIREKDNGIVITYKAPTETEETYAERGEYEEILPRTYIEEGGKIDIQKAVEFLKQKYPEIELPENLQFSVKVNNVRRKGNIKAPDGSTIEIAFDKPSAEDQFGNYYSMDSEFECELLSGNPDALKEIYEAINASFDIERNEHSKYSRATEKLHAQRQTMNLDEITICTMLSDIMRTKEFDQLKYKGQILHDYRVPMTEKLQLDNFEDPQYFVNKIASVKTKKDYKPGKINNLEEMFLCYFSDMGYRDIEYNLVNFLNENYHRNDQAITNRLSHSQQVMLITGLISKSREISEEERKPLLCMASGLVHDIGHVPGAHITEAIIGNIDGFFSHEINGRDVIERIVSADETKILEDIKAYCASAGLTYSDEKILATINKNKEQIKRAIEEHSRTNSEKRGEGTVVQLPREADKICYGISDIVDIMKRTGRTGVDLPIGFFTNEWKEATIKKLGRGYSQKEEIIRDKIEEFEKLIRTNNFGELTTTIANTVRENQKDGKEYYDVEQDTWDILNAMIDYVKGFRGTGVVDKSKRELQQVSGILLTKTFNSALKKHNGNMEAAWDDTLAQITRYSDIDLLNLMNEIRMRFENNPEEWKKAFEPGGILDTTNLLKMNNSDREIRIHPKRLFNISDLLPYFGDEIRTQKPQNILDTYFKNDDGISVCLREYIGTTKKELIVKRKREKGVTQAERERYSSEDTEGISLLELIEKFNREHAEFNIKIPDAPTKCMIRTRRNLFENEDGVTIKNDSSSVLGRNRPIPITDVIEIKCASRDRIKKASQQLKECLQDLGIKPELVITKQTKEELAMETLQREEGERE